MGDALAATDNCEKPRGALSAAALFICIRADKRGCALCESDYGWLVLLWVNASKCADAQQRQSIAKRGYSLYCCKRNMPSSLTVTALQGHSPAYQVALKSPGRGW